MHAFFKSSRRLATIAFAFGLGAAGLATPALAIGHGPIWPRSGGAAPHVGGAFTNHGGNFHSGAYRGGRGNWGGDWGPAFGAGLLGGAIGGAIVGSAYPYYDYGYAPGPCWQYRDVYSEAGAFLGRQLVNICH